MTSFLAGRAPPAEVPAIAAHLDSCGTCRDRVLNAAKAFASTQGSKLSLRPNDAAQGDLVGRYVILARLGSGSMGTVYAAFDPELERKVALKVLSADSKGSAGRELLGEAQALARLAHPNVVPVFDVGEHSGHVFIAMELVKGVTLRQWLETHRKPREVIHLFHQFGEGLLAAHRAGLVHRDFKPENLLVGDDGRGRVTDFGLARLVETPGVTRETSLVLAGTPAYMSPEQLETRPADARSDQFSFCVTLFESLFGRRPFPGDNLVELREAMQKRPVIPLKVGVALRIRQMMARGLSEDPAQRHASMNEVLKPLADPGAWPRRVRLGLAAMVAAASVVAATLTLAKPPPAPAPCAGAERLLLGTWDPARAQALAGAMKQGRSPGAERTFDSVKTTLDRWAADWVKERTAACEATRVRREQSEQLLDRRVACLDRRASEVRALLDVLQYGRDEVEGNAVEAVESLTPLSLCADKNALIDAPPLPEGAAAKAQLREAIDRLSRAKAVLDSAQPTHALEEATLALEAATDAGYAPVLSEAQLQVGLALETDGKHGRAADADALAYEQASAAHDDRTAARAAIHAYRETARARETRPQALVWKTVARSSVARLHDEPALLGELDYFEAFTAYDGYDYRGAANGFHDACELYRHALGPSVELGSCLVREGEAWVQAGDFDTARERSAQGFAMLNQRLGNDHPVVASAHARLGLVSYNLGDLDQAVRELSLALDTVRRVYPHGHLGRFEATFISSYPLLDRGELAQARASAQEASEIARANPAMEDLAAMAGSVMAEVLRREGKLADALAVGVPAFEWRRKHLGNDKATLLADYQTLGQTELALGHLPRALELLEEAAELADASPNELLFGGRAHLAYAKALSKGPKAGRAKVKPQLDAAQKSFEQLSDGPFRTRLLAEVSTARASSLP